MMPTNVIFRGIVEGRSAKVALIEDARGRRFPSVGVLTWVDDRLVSVDEFTRDPSISERVISIRSIRFDSIGRTTGIAEHDVSALDVAEFARLGSPANQVSASKKSIFGRLLKGTADLVLPDVLHAESPTSSRDDPEEGPCTFQQIYFAAAAVAVVIGGLAVDAAALACGIVPLIGCAGFLGALAAQAGFIAVLAYTTWQLDECLRNHNLPPRDQNPPGLAGGRGTTTSGIPGANASRSYYLVEWWYDALGHYHDSWSLMYCEELET